MPVQIHGVREVRSRAARLTELRQGTLPGSVQPLQAILRAPWEFAGEESEAKRIKNSFVPGSGHDLVLESVCAVPEPVRMSPGTAGHSRRAEWGRQKLKPGTAPTCVCFH